MPTRRLSIIESTLREGEQFALAHFSHDERRRIARAVDEFGVEYVEVTTPVASAQAELSCREIAGLDLRATVLTHVRCVPADVELAIDCGVGGVDLLFGTSDWLRSHSHGLNLEEIIDVAGRCIALVRAAGVQVRFSCEEQLPHPPGRPACASTRPSRPSASTASASPTPWASRRRRRWLALIAAVRAAVDCDIEFHAHNDTGCAVANALAALASRCHPHRHDGARHRRAQRHRAPGRSGGAAVDRRGELLAGYRLDQLPGARPAWWPASSALEIPFTSPITAPFAFHHKAGIHTKAVLRDPRTISPSPPSSSASSAACSSPTTWSAAMPARASAALGIAGDEVWLLRVTARSSAAPVNG